MDQIKKRLTDVINSHLAIRPIMEYFQANDKLEMSAMVAASMQAICDAQCSDEAIDAVTKAWIVFGTRRLESTDALDYDAADFIEYSRYARENGETAQAAREALKRAARKILTGRQRDVEDSGILASEACLALLVSARLMRMANSN